MGNHRVFWNRVTPYKGIVPQGLYQVQVDGLWLYQVKHDNAIGQASFTHLVFAEDAQTARIIAPAAPLDIPGVSEWRVTANRARVRRQETADSGSALLSKADFLVCKTRCGCSLRWARNNGRIRTFLGSDARVRARRLMRFLIKYGNENPEIL